MIEPRLDAAAAWDVLLRGISAVRDMLQPLIDDIERGLKDEVSNDISDMRRVHSS